MSESLQDTPPEPPLDAGSRFAKAHHILMFLLASVLLIWLVSGFYQVKTNQVAIVERLGEYVANADHTIIEYRAGLHYHLPWPIDLVHIVSNQESLALTVDAFNSAPSAYLEMKEDLQRQGTPLEFINALFDPYLITADKSIVNMEIKATYRVNNAALWLQTVSHESDLAGEPNDMRAGLFQHLAQRAMIHQVCQMPLEDVLFNQRVELPGELLARLQQDFKIIDPSDTTGKKMFDLGIEIQKVDISALHPPEAVAGAFDEVSNARQQRETTSRSAHTYADSVLTKATADANTDILKAETYATQRIEEARGEADRFQQVLEQYHSSPDITRWDLYSDAVAAVSSAARQVFIAQPGQKTILTVPPPKFDSAQVTTRPDLNGN